MTTANAAAPLPLPLFATTFPGPFPASPYGEHTEQQLLGWLEQHRLLRTSTAKDALANITSHGAARSFPTADADDLALFAQLLLWLTAFDDVHGETSASNAPGLFVDHASELMLVLAGNDSPPAANPFPTALHHLLARFQIRASPTAYHRLTATLRDTLIALVWEAHHAAKPEKAELKAYLAMRPHTVFVRVIMATAEIILDYELTTAQRAQAPVRQLETSVANLAGWINDLASYKRESAQGPAHPLSLPTLLQAQHGGTIQEAFAHANDMCRREAANARQSITALSDDHPNALTTHARALESITHSFIWHTDHARYRS
ncbi:terpene synthase family protein [Streptomyces tendae]